jgi:hypothetical protein
LEKEIIELRPHHVEQLRFEPLLVSEWIRAGKYTEKTEEVAKEELENLIAKLDENEPLEKIMKKILTKISEGYEGTEFGENMKRLHTELIENPKILIVPGIDDICKACAMRKMPFCKNESDWKIVRYGLKIGEIYSMQEILQKLGLSEEVIKEYFNSANELKKLLKI